MLAKASGFLGRYQHLRNAIDLIWNYPRRKYSEERKLAYDPDKHDLFIWNEWTELMMESFCTESEIVIAGPGASWKSTSAALYATCFWFAQPSSTRVIVTSTTGDGLRARFWKEVQHFYRTSRAGIGNPVPSRTIIQFRKGDDAAGIYGIAVESDGNVERAVNKIVGRHNTNMLVVVDELPTVSEAIVEATVNLETGAQVFQFIGLGNPDSHFDPHGKMCEPEKGWNSISELTETWRTKRGGLAIHLDGRRSPRLRDDDKFPGLLRQKDLDTIAFKYGEKSLQYYKQRIGFWCPEGARQSVLSETLIEKFGCMRKIGAGSGISWVSGFVQAAVLDPAFEGVDRRVLRFPKWGEAIEAGETRKAIDLGEYVCLQVDVTSKEPIHYQLVRQCKNECELRGIPPRLFALDSSGEGGALASIFAREWSPEIVQIEFGGSASQRPVSDINPKPCRQEYVNRVTELWFFVRVLVLNRQCYGMDADTAIELCKRTWIMQGNMIKVETKADMKERTGESPDLGDTAALACELFRQRESVTGENYRDSSDDAWAKFVRANAVEQEYAVEV